MFICAGRGENFSFAKEMGVGSEEMAINLTIFLSSLKKLPKNLLFIGTAGSYGEAKIFDIIHSKTASQIELSFLQKNSYTPIENIVSTGGDTKIVNSSNYISTNFELSQKFLKLNIAIENMEFFSFMQVAKKFNIPAGGIFIVTNFTNSSAHEDFKKNHAEAMLKLTNFIETKLSVTLN